MAAVTWEEAIENAARILRNAELETNLPLMERMERIADSWMVMANIIAARNNDTTP